MTVERQIAAVADELRAANAIVIVGAGLSIAAGYPLTRQLAPHVWHAMEADPDVLGELARLLGRSPDSAKALIQDDEIALKAAYELILLSPVARGVFQESFRALDHNRTTRPSPAHDALAELLHRRFVEVVISLNWDTLLEKAYARRYGRRLRADGRWLHKPHGDADDATRPWVLPIEAGRVTDRLIQQVTIMARERPRLLVVVGYSERDEEVVRQLIRPLEDRWRVARIGPTALGDLAVATTADDALARVRDLVVGAREETPGWAYVRFDNQNDLGAALDGRGLGPSDVEACPRLPMVATVRRALEGAHSATIDGDPGSGKSMVAYHVAYDLLRDGREILRLVDRGADRQELIASLEHLLVPTVLLVDDAQTINADLTRALLERANPNLFVLLVTNASPADARGTVHVSGSVAVRALAAALRDRRGEVLAVVRRFDDRVGDGWLDTSLEDRLNFAETALLPWQFTFILTAGERRARTHVEALADENRADLLLALIAARQVATQDVGATEDELAQLAEAIGRDRAWVGESLVGIRRHRLLLGGDHYKCTHQRYGVAVLTIVLERRAEPAFSELVRGLRATITQGEPPPRGIAILLRELWFVDALSRGSREGTVVDDTTWTHLVGRISESQTAHARGAAGFLLEALEGYHANRSEWLRMNAKLVAQWLEEAAPESAWGLSTLLNSLINSRAQDGDILSEIVRQTDPARIARRFSTAAVSEAYAWKALLGRLAFAGPEWRGRFRDELSIDRFVGAREIALPYDVHYITAIAATVRAFDERAAYQLLELTIPAIAERMSDDFPEAYGDLAGSLGELLGFYLLTLDIRPLAKRDAAIMRNIARRVDVDRAASSIMAGSRRTLSPSARLLTYIHAVDARVAKRIAEEIDLRRMDEVTVGGWAKPTHDLEVFVGALCTALGGWDATGEWLARHADEFEIMPARFAAIAPQVAVCVKARGGHVGLDVASVMTWALPTLALRRIAEYDPAIAAVVAMDNIADIAKDFHIPQKDQCEHLDDFVATLKDIAPDVLMAAFEKMDPVTAEANWTSRLRGRVVERRAAAALVDAATTSPRLADVASRLRARFPRATLRTDEPARL